MKVCQTDHLATLLVIGQEDAWPLLGVFSCPERVKDLADRAKSQYVFDVLVRYVSVETTKSCITLAGTSPKYAIQNSFLLTPVCLIILCKTSPKISGYCGTVITNTPFLVARLYSWCELV